MNILMERTTSSINYIHSLPAACHTLKLWINIMISIEKGKKEERRRHKMRAIPIVDVMKYKLVLIINERNHLVLALNSHHRSSHKL